jgi:predicted AlkP superfamily pyrophosphatase or phosphodiesterase
VALYFDDADGRAHRFGLDSAELHAAVQRLDRAIGRLWAGLKELALPVNLIIVSDHGMAKRSDTIVLRDFGDLTGAKVVQAGGAIVHVYAPQGPVRERIYKDLKGVASPSRFIVARKARHAGTTHEIHGLAIW